MRPVSIRIQTKFITNFYKPLKFVGLIVAVSGAIFIAYLKTPFSYEAFQSYTFILLFHSAFVYLIERCGRSTLVITDKKLSLKQSLGSTENFYWENICKVRTSMGYMEFVDKKGKMRNIFIEYWTINIDKEIKKRLYRLSEVHNFELF